MSKILDILKKDKVKITIISISCIIFIIGLIMGFINTGNTYADSLSNYSCNVSGYNPILANDNEYYCCPSGWTYALGLKKCWYKIDAFSGMEAEKLCKSYNQNYGYGLDESDGTYYCTATAGSYMVIYDSKSGNNGPSHMLVIPNSEITISSQIPVRDGYIFKGWDTSSTATTVKYNAGDKYTVTGSTIFYAVWEPEYEVTYDANGGTSAPASVKGEAGKEITISSQIPVRDGYIFKGWDTSSTATTPKYNAGDKYTVTGSTIFYAIWAPEYEVIYDANGGSSAPASVKCETGKEITISSQIPVRDGYEFLGWATIASAAGAKYQPGDVITVSDNVNLYAVWGKYQCYECGSTDTLMKWGSTEPTDFCAAGWFDNKRTEATCKVYTIEYNGNGGSDAPNSGKKTYGDTYTLSTQVPTRSDYTFVGWNTLADGSGTGYQPGDYYTANTDVTLYAQWSDTSTDGGTAITYTVTYNANGGTNPPKSQTKNHGKDLIITSSKPTKVGYTFLGWDTYSSSTNSTYQPGSAYNIDSDITLYAVWKANTYKIEYELNNGETTSNPESGRYDEVVTIKNPTKKVTIIGNSNQTDAIISEKVSKKIKFAGWTSTTINPYTADYDNKPWVSGNTKVTATTFKNLIDIDGATVTMVANWEESVITLPTVTKEDYTCTWNTKADGKGKEYTSGGEYIITSDSAATVNLYAQCIANSKTDQEPGGNPQAGDTLIVLAWLIGIGALGYSVYYFRSRKSNI